MKFHKLTITLLFSLLSLSCSDNEDPTDEQIAKEPTNSEPEEPNEPETRVYFTLNALEPYRSGFTEEWIMAHDENGKLLDYQQFFVGDTIRFEAPIDSLQDNISITILDYLDSESSNEEQHFLSTKTQVEIGAEWTFETSSGSDFGQLIETGEFDLSIQNIPGILKINVSTKKRYIFSSPSPSPYALDTSFARQFKTYEGQDNYLVSVLDGDNDLRYFEFVNPNKEDINLDYNQFKEYDRYININLSPFNQYFLNVAALEDDEPYGLIGGYWLQDLSSFDSGVSTNPLVLGYLNNYTRYRTRFEIFREGYIYKIEQYGLPLEGIIIPERPNLEVIDPSRNSFKFDVDVDYISAVHTWEHFNGSAETNDFSFTRWISEADKDVVPKRGELPSEILDKYTKLEIDQLQLRSTRLNLPIVETEYISNESITIYQQ